MMYTISAVLPILIGINILEIREDNKAQNLV